VTAMRRLVVLAVVIEALVVGGYGVYLAVETLVAPAADRLGAAFLVVLTLALAAGLGALAAAVRAGRRAARAPVLVWQLLQASVAVPALHDRWYLGVGLMLLCVVAGAGVLLEPAESA